MPRVWKHMLVTCTTIGVIVSALLAVTGHAKVQEMAQAVPLPEVEVVSYYVVEKIARADKKRELAPQTALPVAREGEKDA
jgi:hypothetical protein